MGARTPGRDEAPSRPAPAPGSAPAAGPAPVGPRPAARSAAGLPGQALGPGAGEADHAAGRSAPGAGGGAAMAPGGSSLPVPVPVPVPVPGGSGGDRPVRRAVGGVLVALLLGGLVAALCLTLRTHGTGYGGRDLLLTWRYAACWGFFAGAVAALRLVPARWVAAVVVAGAVAVAVSGLVAPPRTSTDSYRYAWDGRVQAAGISPYDHAPADHALDRLRDPWLFPRDAACGHPGSSRLPDGGCTLINRPRVHTIYPPAGELYFLLVHAVSPDHARHKALQTGGAGLSVGTTLLLLRILRRRGDPRTAAYWAWCPAVPMEAVNNAHVDALAVFLSVAALGLAVRRRGTGAAVLGVAVAAKLLPAVLLPGALSGVRRLRDAALTLGVTAAVVVATYVPYVAVSHSSVFGYLGGYAREEGYDDAGAANRYALLRLVLPDSWALPAVVLVMAAVAAYVVRRGDPARPWRGALTVTGTAFLVMTPGYSWYALLLAALVALDGRWEWLGVAAAGAAAYLGSPHVSYAGTLGYGIAAAAVLAGALVRARGAGPAGLPARAGRWVAHRGPATAGGGPWAGEDSPAG